jgi:hypothetical protein
MSKDKIYVNFDGVDREATPEEEARIRARWKEEEDATAAQAAEKAALESKRQEVLAKLGLTAEEAAALLA